MSEESEFDYGQDCLEEEDLCDYNGEQCIGDKMFCEDCPVLTGDWEKRNKKMSLDDLQKALAGRISAKEFRYGNNYWQNAITEEDLKKILTQFFDELSSNFVLISRKQLEQTYHVLLLNCAECRAGGLKACKKFEEANWSKFCFMVPAISMWEKLLEISGKENQK